MDQLEWLSRSLELSPGFIAILERIAYYEEFIVPEDVTSGLSGSQSLNIPDEANCTSCDDLTYLSGGSSTEVAKMPNGLTNAAEHRAYSQAPTHVISGGKSPRTSHEYGSLLATTLHELLGGERDFTTELINGFCEWFGKDLSSEQQLLILISKFGIWRTLDQVIIVTRLLKNCLSKFSQSGNIDSWVLAQNEAYSLIFILCGRWTNLVENYEPAQCKPAADLLYECIDIIYDKEVGLFLDDPGKTTRLFYSAHKLYRYLPTIAGYGSEQNLDGLKSTMSHFVETCWGFHCQEPLRPVSGKQFSLNDALQEFRESGDSCRVTQYIRGMFLEWLYQDYQHSTLTANPSWPHEFLRHEAIYKELQAHIQCGVRIALLYIYQESKLPSGQRAFSPSTNLRALELVKSYAHTKNMSMPLFPVRPYLVECLPKHIELLMNWMWDHLTADRSFVLDMTCAFFIQSCEVGYNGTRNSAISALFGASRESVADVVIALFENINLVCPQQTNESLKTTNLRNQPLEVLLTILPAVEKVDAPDETTLQVLKAMMNCFLPNIESDCILPACWKKFVSIISQIQKRQLQVIISDLRIIVKNSIIHLQRVLLREIEVILRLFKTADPSSGESLRDHLDHLNTMLQFLTIIVVAGEKIRAYIRKESHFLLSMSTYYSKCPEKTMCTISPEIYSIHSASIASLCELFRIIMPMKHTGTDCVISTVTGSGLLDKSFIIAAACSRVIDDSKLKSPKLRFAYPSLMSEIRSFLHSSQEEKWLPSLHAYIDVVEAMLGVTDEGMRRILVDNPWNRDLMGCLLICAGKLPTIKGSDSHQYTAFGDELREVSPREKGFIDETLMIRQRGVHITKYLALKLVYLILSHSPAWLESGPLESHIGDVHATALLNFFDYNIELIEQDKEDRCQISLDSIDLLIKIFEMFPLIHRPASEEWFGGGIPNAFRVIREADNDNEELLPRGALIGRGKIDELRVEMTKHGKKAKQPEPEVKPFYGLYSPIVGLAPVLVPY